MRRLCLTILLLSAVLITRAVTLHCEPGKLASLLNDDNVTELTLTGKMDARDFRTLSDRLRQLRVLNLYGVQIVAYDSDKALFANVSSFRANEIPSLSLANMSQLTRLTLPLQTTSIGEAAVAACRNLTDVTLPKSLKQLGKYAFTGCTSLKTIALPALLQEIGDGAFAQCASLTSVTLQSSDPSPVGENSSPYNYANCHLTTIGARAFAGCKNLKSITLGHHLQTIGDAAFADTKLTQANLSAMAELTRVGNWAYAQSPITTASFNAHLVSIGKGAFVLNPSLTSISLPASLENVATLLLAGSNQLTEVNLGQTSIDSIGDYALYHLNRITQLAIPSSTQYVGTRAMAGMTGLQKITTYAQSVPDLGEDVWQGVDQGSVALMAPGNSVDYYKSADQWRNFNIQSSFKLGDVNGDGTVDIADLNDIINYMLSQSTGTFIFEAADIDQNGAIDITDINGVINIMLNHISSAPAITPDTGDALLIDNFGINTGQRHTIEVHLDNCRDYTALQCVIHLPVGLELREGTVVTGNRALTHSVASCVVGNDVTIILYAMPNVDLGDNADDAILRLTVTATDELAQLSTVLTDHVTLVTADGDSYHAPATSAQVSRTTAVDVVSMSADRVYGANGTLHIVAQQNASAQLVSLNGMTRTLRVELGNNAFHNIDPGIYVVRLNGVSHKVKL